MAAFPSFPWLALRDRAARGRPWCRTALARDVSLEEAITAVARQLWNCGSADLALVFVSNSYASDLPRVLPLLRQKLRASHWIGCLGGGVAGTLADGTARELELGSLVSNASACSLLEVVVVYSQHGSTRWPEGATSSWKASVPGGRPRDSS